jgi:predicted ribosomally synthesized peptide with SipW-like signal peptide
MSNERIRISRRKALVGLGSIGLASAGAGLGTYAQFTDEEQGTTTFTAGGIDGTLECAVSYLGTEVQPMGGEVIDEVPEGAPEATTHVEDGEGAGCSIAFTDIKPGDYGSILFKLQVQNNPAWVASCIGDINDRDARNFEPEVEADDDVDEPNSGPNGVGSETDGELANNMLLIPFYDSDNKSSFFDNNGIPEQQDLQSYGDGTSDDFWDNAQKELKPLTFNQAAAVQGTDTINWSDGAKDPVTEAPPDGTDVDQGCILLDGDLNAGDSSSDNTQEAAPLQDGNTVYFGYDWHLPYTTGNAAQGDEMSVSFGFVFSQTRHSGGPQFVNMYDPEHPTSTGT